MLFFIFVEKSGKRFKFRFAGIEGHPGLKPFAKTWVVGVVAFIIYLLSPPIFEFLLGTTIKFWLISLGLLKLSALTISLGGVTWIYILNYLLEKKLDRNTGIITFVAILAFLIFLL